MPADENPDNKFTLKEAVEILKDGLVGKELMDEHGGWPMYSKFFDFGTPLFHHLHLDFESAARVNRLGKPEAYYFPRQLNNHLGEFPATYFGFDADVTKEMVKERLQMYKDGDNRVTEISHAYRIELSTGWYTPPGVIHAPGSVLTYEPQWNSNVNSVYENIVSGESYPYEFLVENCPQDKKDDIDYVISLMDWEKNVEPHYRKRFFRPPIPVTPENKTYSESWVVYGNDYVAAKELTIAPGETCVIKDKSAYGCIMLQGHGMFGAYRAEAAVMLRFGQPSADEFFVSEEAAKQGIVIKNESVCEPMVILKHFGPNNPDTPKMENA